tara:strand:- start:2768 stop:4099 length:1332 start_codon:yes stop_codon:yes gene_type:complete
MTIFDLNPASSYRNLKERIPIIKKNNRDFMNKLHKFKLPTEFWWAISGEYAIMSEHLCILSTKDPRLLYGLRTSNKEFPPLKMISSSIIRSFGRESIVEKNPINYKGNSLKNIEEILIDDESKNFPIDINKDPINETLPFISFTLFLNQLRLRKFKYLFLKIKNKFKKLSNNSDYNKDFLKEDHEVKNFDKILEIILPDYLNEYFPKWFVWVSEYIISSKYKWVTKFGYGRDIYQIILLAKSYEKFGDKNIQILSHGSNLSIQFWHMFRISLFPNLKLYSNPDALMLPKFEKAENLGDILFCPGQLPYVGDFFSIDHYRSFIDVYKTTVSLLSSAINDGLKIKIRYKNFDHISGFGGPLTIEECQLPIENEKFEDIYHKYKLIVSMPFGTISEKCYFNNVNCLTYNYPFYLTNKKSYLKTNSYTGVFGDSDKFLNELKKKLKV